MQHSGTAKLKKTEVLQTALDCLFQCNLDDAPHDLGDPDDGCDPDADDFEYDPEDGDGFPDDDAYC